ncbi:MULTISPECIES: ABC transporter ATP-binding protein [unclassified Facklamia]|uniref:ABC transporter ATP-binding protein n=1 Tax=Aerococcaceae TaxID=186827 RepID=UPI0013B5BD28|nr:ATP-binding cassette domain-containing protein [Facklamia sp. 252]NEW67447.1 ATP-binding cassette domain-containing protein [Facklamia sp. 253]QQD65321.1 ABC transporter ATP-binding protein [Aerococcaceae bacterium zg-252]
MQVRFDNVTMQFENKKVLDNINFTLPSGELISFLGPSGCGKSTTLYLISGLLNATSGNIYFDDKDVTKLDPVKRQVGLVFQNYALYPHLTVLENIMFPLKMAKMPKAQRIEIGKEMAALTQIHDQLDKYPRQLSGGQQQRVAISRALAKSPSILLMDEPLSNLDARLRIEMREEIRRIQQETGVTTVFVTHDQEEALSIADNVMVLNQGEIQQMTDPVTLYREPSNLFVAKFIGTPIINTFTKNSPPLNPNAWVMNHDWETLGIRSEHFRLGTLADHLVSATVQRVEQVGKDVTIHCECNGETFVVSDIDAELPVGEQIFLTVEPKHLMFFNQKANRVEVV